MCSKETSVEENTKANAIRVDELLSRMTLEEKIGQMTLVERNSISDDDVRSYAIGAVLSGGGGKPADNTAEGWRTMVENFQSAAKQSRLGIPLLYGVDAIHGHSNIPGATIFPHEIGLGAAHNTALVEQIAKYTSEEVVATNINWNFMPSLDEPRDMRWGRTYENFGQDVELVSKLGAAYVRGEQAFLPGTNWLSVLGTAKHYIGAGSMLWGTSVNRTYKIDQGQTPANEVALRQEYLPPFQAAINADVGSVMVGLNEWGTTRMAASKYLITDVLKEELNFKGFVVSDWYGVYKIPGGNYFATVTAINAGVDMVMVPFDYKPFIKNVQTAVERGDISQARIDDAVRRILAAKFSLGLFDTRPTVPLEVIGSADHRALARTAVQQSLVLLKNDDVFPLNTTAQNIIVAGSAADNVGMQCGGWTIEWQGVDGNWLPNTTSIWQGIKSSAPLGTVVDYQRDGRFGSGPLADIGIAIVGEKPYAEGVGDKVNPSISPADQAVIARLRAKSKKLVVIIVSGRPLSLGKALTTSDALVAAWLPGSEGAGVADVLFGRAPFVGTLPVAWPGEARSVAAKAEPLFPLGFGLTK